VVLPVCRALEEALISLVPSTVPPPPVDEVDALLQADEIGCFHLKHGFSCELDPSKQDWVKQLLQPSWRPDDTGPLHPDSCCCFQDITHLGESTAWCVSHYDFCKVPSATVGAVGFSCTDLSKNNPNSSSKVDSLGQDDGTGSTYKTFWGMISWVEQCRPSAVILENVDAIADESKDTGQSNLDTVVAELSCRGYEVQPVLVDCQEYGLPQRRKRVYFLGIRAADPIYDFCRCGMRDSFQVFVSMMQRCKLDPCNLQDVLLVDGSALLERAKASATTECKTAARDKTWTQLHMSFYRDHKLQWGRLPPCSFASSLWWSAVPRREQDIYHATEQLCRRSKRPLPICQDGSQNIFRAPTSGRHMCSDAQEIIISPCVLPGSNFFLFNKTQQRYITGEEKMVLQGWPTRHELYADLVARTDDKVLHSLAGNAFSSTVAMAMVFSWLASMPFARDHSQAKTTDHDVTAALGALKRLNGASDCSTNRDA